MKRHSRDSKDVCVNCGTKRGGYSGGRTGSLSYVSARGIVTSRAGECVEPPAPAPQTGADEAARRIAESWIPAPSVQPDWRGRLFAAVQEAYAAGRARGIAEMDTEWQQIYEFMRFARDYGAERGRTAEWERCERIAREAACAKADCKHEGCHVARAIVVIIGGVVS